MTTVFAGPDAWLAWADRHGVPAARTGSVLASLQPCYQVMNDDPGAIPTLTTNLGQLQAWLHERPTYDAPGGALDWRAALARLDDEIDTTGVDVDLVRGLRARLDQRDPGPQPDADPVPCHGDFTPVTVHLHPHEHHNVVVTGWTDAVLADAEYDLSFSELGLWASAYLTPEEEVRTMLKLARSFLWNGYLAGYRALAGEPDPHRMRWWGGYHACRLLVAPLLTATPFRDWDPAVAGPVVASFRADLADRFDALLEPMKGASR